MLWAAMLMYRYVKGWYVNGGCAAPQLCSQATNRSAAHQSAAHSVCEAVQLDRLLRSLRFGAMTIFWRHCISHLPRMQVTNRMQASRWWLEDCQQPCQQQAGLLVVNWRATLPEALLASGAALPDGQAGKLRTSWEAMLTLLKQARRLRA